MSNIESLGKHPAVPLILDQEILLTTMNQRWLASLLCLITMRFEFLTGGTGNAVSPEDRNWLRYHREPSQHWHIWIGRFSGENPEDHWARSYAAQLTSLPTDKVGPEYCNVQVTTLVIGRLCTHIFFSQVIPFAGYEGINLSKIWPPNRFDINTAWFPNLGDKDVLWLHEAFGRETTPMPRPE